MLGTVKFILNVLNEPKQVVWQGMFWPKAEIMLFVRVENYQLIEKYHVAWKEKFILFMQRES